MTVVRRAVYIPPQQYAELAAEAKRENIPVTLLMREKIEHSYQCEAQEKRRQRVRRALATKRRRNPAK
jgi:hypothetical protein